MFSGGGKKPENTEESMVTLGEPEKPKTQNGRRWSYPHYCVEARNSTNTGIQWLRFCGSDQKARDQHRTTVGPSRPCLDESHSWSCHWVNVVKQQWGQFLVRTIFKYMSPTYSVQWQIKSMLSNTKKNYLCTQAFITPLCLDYKMW